MLPKLKLVCFVVTAATSTYLFTTTFLGLTLFSSLMEQCGASSGSLKGGTGTSSFTSRGATSKNYLSGGFWEQPFAKPYFENSTKRDVTTTVGQTAYLHCRVRNLGDRAVSWIRKRDLHILTVGILTYTGDQRFQSLHSDGTDEWTLKVSSAQIRDSGTYECQVSTEPKISMAFHLSVVVSQAEILGNSELHIKSGSDINLTCIVKQTPEPPTYIYWYHGRRVINYSQRGGINVVTEKQTRTSRLLISKAQPNDSGNYTCSPSNSESASALVHVLNGENPAAMQHGNNHGVPSSRVIFLGISSLFNNIHFLLTLVVVFHGLLIHSSCSLLSSYSSSSAHSSINPIYEANSR